jgi:hypothetical protein
MIDHEDGKLPEQRQRLTQCKVTHVAIVNPQHFHSVPGQKTDPKDSRWIAELLS